MLIFYNNSLISSHVKRIAYLSPRIASESAYLLSGLSCFAHQIVALLLCLPLQSLNLHLFSYFRSVLFQSPNLFPPPNHIFCFCLSARLPIGNSTESFNFNFIRQIAQFGHHMEFWLMEKERNQGKKKEEKVAKSKQPERKTMCYAPLLLLLLLRYVHICKKLDVLWPKFRLLIRI